MNELVSPSILGNWPEGFSSAPSILLVDDEIAILNSMRRLLRPLGYHIIMVNSGEEALAILEEETVDLIISDMRMPNMDGAQLLSQVRQKWPDTLRILLTGYADISSTVDAINKAEIYRYVAKPWDDEEMLVIVRRALEQKGLAKERTRLQGLLQQKIDELAILNASLEEKVQERTQELAKTHEELTRSHDRLKHGFLTSIKVFSHLIEMRSGPFFTGHSRKVAELARSIAEQMKFPRQKIQDVMLAGLLHDIGKIGFPDALMAKPISQFSPEEVNILKKYPSTGATALIAIEELHNAALLIRHQLERYDGTGFPAGLSGDAIPEGAYILALASDYHAAQLGLRIPKKLTSQEAKNWIAKGAGNRYAPKVVEAFLQVTTNQVSTPLFKERSIPSSMLASGMILERDIITHEGLLIIEAGHIVDDALIQQIRHYEMTEKIVLSIWIRCF